MDLNTNRTGMHRKIRIITAAIIVKHVATWIMLLGLTGALGALSYSLVPQPASAASTSWVGPVSQSVMQAGASLNHH